MIRVAAPLACSREVGKVGISGYLLLTFCCLDEIDRGSWKKIEAR